MRHPDEGTGQRPGRLPDDVHLDEGTIHAWLDGALDAAEAARVERHATTCEACSAMVAEARGLVAAASRILTRLDDVPARVIPAGASAASIAAAPTPASVGPRLARKATESAARRRRRWPPTVWTISAAAAAVLMAVLVTGNEAERLLDQPMPASATDAAPLASEQASEQASVQATDQTSVQATDQTSERAAEQANAPAAGAKAEAESSDAASTAAAVPAQAAAPAPAPAVAQERAPRVARSATVDAPTPPVAVEDAQRSERRVGGFVPRASDAPAPAQAAVPEQLRGRVGSALGAASSLSQDSSLLRYDGRDTAADFQLAEVPVWSDSLTRARLPRQIGFGRRILAGARLVESTIATTTNEVERRSVYELEDGVRVTLIEGPTTAHLEAVVTTSAGAAPPAAQSAPQENARPRAAAAPAVRQEAAKTVAPADSAAMLEPVGAESVVVRPDGTIRLEWRDGGTAMALEGPLSIDRLRALRDRVRY